MGLPGLRGVGMRMSSDEDHLCRKDGAERWAEKMLVSSCDILRERGTWKTEEAGDRKLEQTEQEGRVAEAFSGESKGHKGVGD